MRIGFSERHLSFIRSRSLELPLGLNLTLNLNTPTSLNSESGLPLFPLYCKISGNYPAFVRDFSFQVELLYINPVTPIYFLVIHLITARLMEPVLLTQLKECDTYPARNTHIVSADTLICHHGNMAVVSPVTRAGLQR